MKRLFRAIVTALVAIVFGTAPITTGVLANVLGGAGYAYDNQVHPAVLAFAAAESSPPSAYDPGTSLGALHCWRACAPTPSGSAPPTLDYRYLAEALQVAKAAATTLEVTPDARRTAVLATRSHVAANTLAKACSFSGTTLVLMADGTKRPIEEVKVGDKVIATDPETGEQVAKTVEHVFVHDDALTDLALADGSVLTTTEDHPYWSVDDQRFERANQLAPGEKVLGADGRTVGVSGLRLATTHQGLAYNLAVGGIHTYHVGDDAILVHNVCALWDLTTLSESGARLSKGGLTRAGQKFSQHGGQGAFSVAKGSVTDLNRLGQEQLDDILTSPGTITRGITGGNFAGGRYYIAPDGRGAAFDANGAFQYFGVFTP